MGDVSRKGDEKDKRGDHQDATRRAVWMANYQRGPEESAEKSGKLEKKKIEGCKLPYGIYAFKFGSLPNWCDDDWLDWGLFLFFLSSHSFKNVRRNVYPYFLIETTQVLCAPHYVNSPTFAQIYFQFLSHRHVKTRE
jgi:hypothetical protein